MGAAKRNTYGISISLPNNRIAIYLETLERLGLPEYYRFLLDPDKHRLCVQGCRMEDEGAKKVNRPGKYCFVNSINLIRFIYSTSGWESDYSYRLSGVYRESAGLVEYDLTAAEKIGKSEKHYTESRREVFDKMTDAEYFEGVKEFAKTHPYEGNPSTIVRPK